MAEYFPPEIPLTQSRNEAFNAIVSGATKQNLVRIRYRDKEGLISERNIEPYQFKEGKLFGYDVEKMGIRSFKTENITGAITLDEGYEPRYPVLINNDFAI